MKLHGTRLAKLAALLSIAWALGACGEPSTGPSMTQIPRYPGASAGESMQASAPLGLMGGSIEQYTTHDSYEDVMAFYREALADTPNQVTTHETPLGRQTAIAIELEDGGITVAIQEFREEAAVNITLMAVGS